jgi:hypothetical protein
MSLAAKLKGLRSAAIRRATDDHPRWRGQGHENPYRRTAHVERTRMASVSR